MSKDYMHDYPVRKLLAMLLVLFLCHTALAQQTGTIAGRVTGEEEALPGATVSIPGTRYGVQSDAGGNYRIELPAGTYTVVTTFVGYGKQETKGVKVTANATYRLDINLSVANAQLKEVTVSYGSNARARLRAPLLL